jgi:hypothetical protein
MILIPVASDWSPWRLLENVFGVRKVCDVTAAEGR